MSLGQRLSRAQKGGAKIAWRAKAWSGIAVTDTATQARVLWLKLDCLNPNSQVSMNGTSGKRLITGCGWHARKGASRSTQGQANRRPQASEFKGMSGKPTGR